MMMRLASKMQVSTFKIILFQHFLFVSWTNIYLLFSLIVLILGLFFFHLWIFRDSCFAFSICSALAPGVSLCRTGHMMSIPTGSNDFLNFSKTFINGICMCACEFYYVICMVWVDLGPSHDTIHASSNWFSEIFSILTFDLFVFEFYYVISLGRSQHT